VDLENAVMLDVDHYAKSLQHLKQAPHPSPTEQAQLLVWCRPAFRIVIAYVVSASLWILTSDKVLALLITNPADRVSWSIAKGWGFVVVTALPVFAMIRKMTRQMEEQHFKILAGETKCRALIDKSHDAISLLADDGAILWRKSRSQASVRSSSPVNSSLLPANRPFSPGCSI
jgi:hypothetical protein